MAGEQRFIAEHYRACHAPIGFERRPIPAGSFEDWLRHLPTKKGSPPVHLFDGTLKANQNAHIAVIDIDTGDKDLQQCADAVIRLRAEYLYSLSRYNDIHFDFTSGDKASFRKWINGYRPVVTEFSFLVSFFESRFIVCIVSQLSGDCFSLCRHLFIEEGASECKQSVGYENWRYLYPGENQRASRPCRYCC